MGEMTKRGQEDRKHEDEVMTGEPVQTGTDPAATPAPVTRDKGVAPAADSRGEGRGAEKQS